MKPEFDSVTPDDLVSFVDAVTYRIASYNLCENASCGYSMEEMRSMVKTLREVLKLPRQRGLLVLDRARKGRVSRVFEKCT